MISICHVIISNKFENLIPLVTGEGTCEGDSGAPLVVREFSGDPYYQIGVASFGASKCGQNGVPGIYTKVTAYLPWIESKMKL